MSSKQTRLNDLERSILSLEHELLMKTAPSEQTAQTFAAPRASLKRAVFLEGEVLILGGMSKDAAITLLTDMTIQPGDYVLTTEGNPLFFNETNAIPDTSAPFPYYLKHSDLPHGFVGTPDAPGTFQFSSKEVEQLKLPVGPQIIDDVYVFYGSRVDGLTYDMIKNDKLGRFQFSMWGLGWAPGSTLQEVTANVGQGNYVGLTLQDGYSTYKKYFADQQPYLDYVEDLSGVGNLTNKVGGIGSNYYNPGRYIGWRWWLNRGEKASKNEVTVPILEMPVGQLSEFEVNPEPQQPYRGAEGVYPVILVEFLRDVNVLL